MGILSKIFIIVFFFNFIEGRPISYSGGHTLMHFNDSMKESIYYHFSPTYKYSIGLETLNNKEFGQHESNIKFTYLINRKIQKTLKGISTFNQQFQQMMIIIFMVCTVIGKLDVISLDSIIKK